MAWQDRDDGPRPIQPLYTRCPRRPVLGRDRDGSMARKPGNGHRGNSADWRCDADARPHSARRPSSREGRRAVSAPVIRRRAAVHGPGLRHGRSMRSPPRAWRRIDQVAGCVAVRASRGRLGNTVAVQEHFFVAADGAGCPRAGRLGPIRVMPALAWTATRGFCGPGERGFPPCRSRLSRRAVRRRVLAFRLHSYARGIMRRARSGSRRGPPGHGRHSGGWPRADNGSGRRSARWRWPRWSGRRDYAADDAHGPGSDLRHR